jgi:flagellar biosynthesis protein FliR
MTMDQLPFTLDTIEAFLLVFVRIATMLSLFPIFGSTTIPLQVKVGLSLFIAVLVFIAAPGLHTLAPHAGYGPSVPLLFLLIIKEVLVGLTIGFVSAFLFASVQFAARLIDMEIGFGMVDLIDPMSEESITVMGQLWIVVFTVVLLLINGHYFFILAIEKSFAVIPLADAHMRFGPIASHLIDMTGQVFVLSLKLSAPIYVTLIMTEMTLGIVARTAPQINVYFVGLPGKILIGIVTTVIAFPMLSVLFKKIFEGMMGDIWSVLYLLA